jgi:two-component system sensor histidine kinase RegB
MGLGLFIARTLLERTGASLSFANGSDGRRKNAAYDRPPGAIIEMLWPVEALVISKDQHRRALGQNQRFQE